MVSPSIQTMHRLFWLPRTAAVSIAPLTAVARGNRHRRNRSLAGRSLRFRPDSSTELFLGTSSLAVFRSTDGGDHFVQSSHGISEINLFSVDANPLASNELAIAFQGQNNGGCFKVARRRRDMGPRIGAPNPV